ncbi:MAG: hypothetical protein ABSH41_29240 [Syntrophobacteraceae bacterium]
MATVDGPMSDKEWQAHDDAHTLSRAQEIMADEKRLKAAAGAAKKIADDLAEQVKNMSGVASGSLLDKMYPKMQTKKE